MKCANSGASQLEKLPKGSEKFGPKNGLRRLSDRRSRKLQVSVHCNSSPVTQFSPNLETHLSARKLANQLKMQKVKFSRTNEVIK